jgi:hypothetical protein
MSEAPKPRPASAPRRPPHNSHLMYRRPAGPRAKVTHLIDSAMALVSSVSPALLDKRPSAPAPGLHTGAALAAAQAAQAAVAGELLRATGAGAGPAGPAGAGAAQGSTEGAAQGTMFGRKVRSLGMRVAHARPGGQRSPSLGRQLRRQPQLPAVGGELLRAQAGRGPTTLPTPSAPPCHAHTAPPPPPPKHPTQLLQELRKGLDPDSGDTVIVVDAVEAFSVSLRAVVGARAGHGHGRSLSPGGASGHAQGPRAPQPPSCQCSSPRKLKPYTLLHPHPRPRRRRRTKRGCSTYSRPPRSSRSPT